MCIRDSPSFENEIVQAGKKVELITAKIFDINDEDIQGDYLSAFMPIKQLHLTLSGLYNTEGFTDESQKIMIMYNELMEKFIEEYEI